MCRNVASKKRLHLHDAIIHHHSPSHPIDELLHEPRCRGALQSSDWSRDAVSGMPEAAGPSVRQRLVGAPITPGCSCRWGRSQPMVDGRLQKSCSTFCACKVRGFRPTIAWQPWLAWPPSRLGGPVSSVQSLPAQEPGLQAAVPGRIAAQALRGALKERFPQPIRSALPLFSPSSPTAHPSSYPLFCSPSRRQPYTLLKTNR